MQSDELMKVSPISRCNEGNNQSAPWNPAESSYCNRRRILPQEMQNDLECPSSQDLPPPPPPSPLPHPHSLPLLEKPLPIVTTSNGRSDLLGRGLDQGLGPGQGSSGQCRALGVGDCGPGLGRNPLVQELSELESQILVIKQQLQSAMRRKRELEQYQSENQQANQTAPSQPTSHQSNQFVQYTQTHQQIKQHKNTCPELWSQSQFVQEREPWLTHWTSFQNLSWVPEQILAWVLKLEASPISNSRILLMALELPSTLHWNVRQWSDPALQFQVGHFLTPGTWDWIRWEVLDKGEPGILNQICSVVSLKSFVIPCPSQLPLYYNSLTPFHAYLVLLPFSCLFLPFVPAMPPPLKPHFSKGTDLLAMTLSLITDMRTLWYLSLID